MRKIEQQMVAAIRQRKNWSSGNTRVAIMQEEGMSLVIVTLHGHVIANVGTSEMRVTLAGWPTVTTRSRLNAILCALAQGDACVFQRKGEQFFRQRGTDVEIGSREWIATTTGSQHYEQQEAAAEVQL